MHLFHLITFQNDGVDRSSCPWQALKDSGKLFVTEALVAEAGYPVPSALLGVRNDAKN